MPFPQLNAAPDKVAALNLGSENAFETPTEDRSLPTPPPGYMPGYTAPARLAQEDSLLFRIGEVMSAGGTRPGEIPAPIKLRMAKQAADLDASNNKLAWDNFYAHNRATQEIIKQNNRNAMTQGLTMLPHFKDLIQRQTDPVKRTALAKHLGKLTDNFSPGLSKVLDLMDKNPSQILGADMILAHPTYGPMLKDVMSVVGYENIVDDPRTKQIVEMFGRDTIPLIVSRFDEKQHVLLESGKMTQAQFVEAYKKATYDESFGAVKPLNAVFALSLIDTPYGEEIMAGMKVQTNKMALAIAKKEKPEGQQDLAKELKNESIRKAKADLEDAEANPGKYSREYVAQLKEDIRIHAGLVAKQSNQSVNPNNSVIQRFDILTKGKYGRYEDLPKMAEGPEKEEAYAAAAVARKQADKASADAAMGAKMGAPGDASGYIDAEKLRTTGRAIGITEAVSEGELRSNRKKYLKATPDQKKNISEMNIAENSVDDIFDLADKTFKPGSELGESVAESVLLAPQGVLTAMPKAEAKALYPELTTYLARRESTLGKFARSISGEVGVLTDQDVGRVRNIFPVGGDTKQIRAAKRKAIAQLVALNKRFQIEVLAGEMLPEDVELLKKSPKWKSAVNGILGSAEGLSKQISQAPQAGGAPTDTRSRAERLAEKMQKGE